MVVQQAVVYDEVAPVVEQKKAKVQRAAAPKVEEEEEAPAPVKKEKAKVQRSGSSTLSKQFRLHTEQFQKGF